MAYRLSQAADNDLISLYLEGAMRFGLAQADRYHESLARAFRFLAEHPKAARERTEINPPVRCHPHGAHMIIYLIDGDGDAYILRVRHAREDWESDTL